MNRFTVIDPFPSMKLVKNVDVERHFEGLKIIERKDWKDGEAFLVEGPLSVAIWFAKSINHECQCMNDDPFDKPSTCLGDIKNA